MQLMKNWFIYILILVIPVIAQVKEKSSKSNPKGEFVLMIAKKEYTLD